MFTASSSCGGQQGCKGGKLKLKTEKSWRETRHGDGQYRGDEKEGAGAFPKVEGGTGWSADWTRERIVYLRPVMKELACL